jgi:hypothetical protein
MLSPKRWFILWICGFKNDFVADAVFCMGYWYAVRLVAHGDMADLFKGFARAAYGW